jgi:structural maintenance of chromosome 3 (chondroitin sulfate proteoglycan 6)
MVRRLVSLLTVDNEARIDTLTNEIADIDAQIKELQDAQLGNSRSILKSQKNAERLLTKRATLTARKEECSKNIRDLGILPEEAYHKYINTKSDKVGSRPCNTDASFSKSCTGSPKG